MSKRKTITNKPKKQKRNKRIASKVVTSKKMFKPLSHITSEARNIFYMDLMKTSNSLVDKASDHIINMYSQGQSFTHRVIDDYYSVPQDKFKSDDIGVIYFENFKELETVTKKITEDFFILQKDNPLANCENIKDINFVLSISKYVDKPSNMPRHKEFLSTGGITFSVGDKYVLTNRLGLMFRNKEIYDKYKKSNLVNLMTTLNTILVSIANVAFYTDNSYVFSSREMLFKFHREFEDDQFVQYIRSEGTDVFDIGIVNYVERMNMKTELLYQLMPTQADKLSNALELRLRNILNDVRRIVNAELFDSLIDYIYSFMKSIINMITDKYSVIVENLQDGVLHQAVSSVDDIISEEEYMQEEFNKEGLSYIDSYRELNSLASKYGYELIRCNGDHGIFKNESGYVVVIPQGRKIGKGLSLQIQKSIKGSDIHV